MLTGASGENAPRKTRESALDNLNTNITSESLRAILTHEIVVTDAADFSTADAAMIERFAVKQSDSVWKLAGKTVLQAMETGDRAEDILRVLRSGSGVEIPDTVRRLVEETADRAAWKPDGRSENEI